MIVSFQHKGLEKLFYDGDGSKLPPQLLKRIKLILFVLDNAETMEDINVPGFNLHQLKGDMKGLWAVKVNGNYRIVFGFAAAKVELFNIDVFDVDYMDYH